jgi:hypothetical protein
MRRTRGRWASTLPIGPRLLLPVLLAVGGGAVRLLRPPTLPASCRLPAVQRAVTAQRMGRPEEAVAPFEQAAPWSSPGRPLQPTGRVGE